MKLIVNFFFALMVAVCGFGANAQCVSDSLLTGKSLWVIGDSYVRNHRCPQEETWHAKAAAKLGMEYHNLGRNGNCIAFDRTKEGFGEQMTVRYRQISPDADYILIIAGHNDADKIKDDAMWKQFTDSLDYLCTAIKERCPKARIGIVTPWAVDRPMFAEVIGELKAAGGRHGIPVLDMAYTAGIRVNDDEFRAKYFQNRGVRDTAHLTDAGHNLVLPYGLAFIRLLAAQPR